MLHKGHVILIESLQKLKELHKQERLEEIFLRLVEDEQRKG